MLAYKFDENTKEYKYTLNAQVDPKAGGYLLPANSTFIEPSETQEGYVNCFIDEQWTEVLDHRKQPQINLTTLEISDVDYLGEAQEGYQFISEDVKEEYLADTDKYKVQNGVFVKRSDEEYQQIKTSKRQAKFETEFFNTSLGFVRRSVNMANGNRKDFLSDLLPTITMGVNMGQEVKIITYNQPSFDEDVEDWSEYQNIVIVTTQFIQECFQRLSDDFLPMNDEFGGQE